MSDKKVKSDSQPEPVEPEEQKFEGGDNSVVEQSAELVEDEGETLLAAMSEEEEVSEFALARPLPRALEVRKRTPLARYDPLQAYMRDVKRYQLLSPEEEQATAVQYFETGDVKAAAKLVTSNLRLVVKIAYDYRNAYKNLMDIVQEGNIGLMQAVRKYDPYKGVKLSTYAAWWIRAYILRFILNNARLVKLGTTQAQRKLFFNLKKEKAKLAAMGIEPTFDAVAKRLDVSKQEVIEMDRRLAAGDLSLDAPIRKSDEGSKSRVEFLKEESKDVDDVLADEQLSTILREKLEVFAKTLAGKEARIFDQRLISEEPKTLQEIGDEFGVSRERVRQIEKRLQDKIRKYLTDELGENAFDA